MLSAWGFIHLPRQTLRLDVKVFSASLAISVPTSKPEWASDETWIRGIGESNLIRLIFAFTIGLGDSFPAILAIPVVGIGSLVRLGLHSDITTSAPSNVESLHTACSSILSYPCSMRSGCSRSFAISKRARASATESPPIGAPMLAIM
ncbi:hypothetical protein M408DRAFT_9359 [Serendipita vermifera MAFF 305830]|uniref:Uncharacterized protein n=1 Tax=Serendipita vermifera MAFF 305830 TaxID=933852 RepID=A0A0C3B7H2_SERVB|nr:hypothetical protein M408DRAFT_9359 [Serendipita vermifera MAFF 305830]